MYFSLQFQTVVTAEPELVKRFLNNLLNHLNWSITELDQTLTVCIMSRITIPSHKHTQDIRQLNPQSMSELENIVCNVRLACD